jgi:organic radical activating enzyme
MKAKYLVSVLDILYKKYGIKFNINDTNSIVKQATKKIDEINTFKDMPTTNGSHLAANVVDFLKERDQKKRGDK